MPLADVAVNDADQATHALTRDPTAMQRSLHPGEWLPGQVLGPYRLQRKLGQGGMGVVWLALQTEPLRREVALKLLPRNDPDPLAEAYFEVERQALAQLSHRAIAQIHDAGRLPDGTPFFAMEYVPGQPLDAFARSEGLGLRERIALLLEVCRGLQHAHQRGVVHRDIKPLNILVQRVDGLALPKLIDFGIAVAARGEDEAGTRVRSSGTPAYMAPEQRQATHRVDARSDVYALGAVLVDLLVPPASGDTGTLDGTQRRLGVAASLERTTARNSGDALPAGSRDLALRLRAVPRPLRAIAARALQEDIEARYDSASALAAELEAWLDDRPVAAMGDRRSYRIGCFLRRHRLATAAAAAIVLALCAGMALALHGLRQARAAEQIAEQRRDAGERLIHYMLGEFADKLRPIARLDLLDGIGGQALDHLSEQGPAASAAQALARARALRTLGEVQVTRQQFELAQRSLDEALALLDAWPDPGPELAADLAYESGTLAFWRGAVEYRQGRLAETEPYWRRYLAEAQRLQALAADDPRGERELGFALNNLGTLANARGEHRQAGDYFGQVVALRRAALRGVDDHAAADLANALSWLARTQQRLGQPRAARDTVAEAVGLVEALRIEADTPRLRQQEINLRHVLAWNLHWLGDDPAALQQLRQALPLSRADVANDPSQARRWLLRARLAWSLATFSGPGTEGEQALAEAREAQASAAFETLAAEEREGLMLQDCLAAHRVLDDDADLPCVAAAWAVLSAPSLPDSDLAHAAQLAALLHRLDPQRYPEPPLRELEARLLGLSGEADGRHALGDLLALRELQSALGRVDPSVSALIENLRANTSPHHEEP